MEKFLWGASIAAHQVEGGNDNHLCDWEEKNAENLAKTAMSRLSWNPYINEISETVCNINNYISGRAIDHYNRFKDDFKYIKEIGLNAFRFSIEWSRIEPEEGKWNQKALDYYREYIKELVALGIEPMVTLWHWSMPKWLVKNEKEIIPKDFKKYFTRFVSKVVGEYKENVRYWITLNEPESLLFGYLNDSWIFQSKSLLNSYFEYLKLARVHNVSYKEIKKIQRDSFVSVAWHKLLIVPKTKSFIDKLGSKIFNFFQNHFFLLLTKKNIDYIGVNNYFRSQIHNFKQENENKITSDMGFELYPESLYGVLKEMKIYKLPIIVTEHGLADSKDKYRGWYITESLKGLFKAKNEGVDVRGYFHWSLLDNFEWNSGFWPKFGLVEVDSCTLERKIRKSAYVYREIIENSSI